MKNFLIVFTVIVFGFSNVCAQIGSQMPQHSAYYHTMLLGGGGLAGWGYYSFGIGASKRLVNASLYPVGSFTAPAGKITHIYVAGNGAWNYYAGKDHFEPTALCMGHTSLSSFDSISKDTSAVKTLLSGLQRVVVTGNIKCFDSSVYTGFYTWHNNDMWVKIKLDHPFMYDPNQSLILGGDVNSTFGEGVEGFLRAVRVTEDSLPHYMSGIKPFDYYYIVVNRDTNTGKASVHKARQYVDFGFDIQPSSVDDEYPQYAYRVYPNPAREALHVEGVEKIGAYEVYDMTGRLLLQSQSSTHSIPVSTLTPGMYLLRFVNRDTPYTVRFQKE